jgi:hypothetical protein
LPTFFDEPSINLNLSLIEKLEQASFLYICETKKKKIIFILYHLNSKIIIQDLIENELTL